MDYVLPFINPTDTLHALFFGCSKKCDSSQNKVALDYSSLTIGLVNKSMGRLKAKNGSESEHKYTMW